MSDQPITYAQLGSGVYFSPGFYMGYWENVILKQFDAETVLKHERLKQHREVWVGAILAAARTESTGLRHFVGLPDTDPPDVEIVGLEPIEYKGKPSHNLPTVKVEIVRCDFGSNEEIINQINKKVEKGYENMTLCVYVYGGGKVDNLEELHQHLLSKELRVKEVVLVLSDVRMAGSSTQPSETYAVIGLYPARTQVIVSRNNSAAFFRGNPDILKKTGRGTGRDLTGMGNYMLLPPEIN